MNRYKIIAAVIVINVCMLNLSACNRFAVFDIFNKKYTGDIDFNKYTWLAGKKIFLDPGHGGKGNSDKFRIGPGGITEEEINLRVSLILEDMLKRSGAIVSLSRRKDNDVSLYDRANKANSFQPDLLISLHHNGSCRAADTVNYPMVMIWGNRRVSPASYDFAEMLLAEFQRYMDKKGKGSVVSDFAVYKETGTHILRETRYLCPGVIGEPSFFSDDDNAKRLNDGQYNQEEAEAYFYAISAFLKRGIPNAEVLISSPLDNESRLISLANDRKPIIAIKTDSGLAGNGILNDSLDVTFDDIRVKCRAVTGNLFFVDYGSKLYPGNHFIRFSFRNSLSRSSMIFTSGFRTEIKKGDYDKLVSDGIKLLNVRTKQNEGLKMILSAFSMGSTDPDADKLLWNIANGFAMIGDKVNSDYYYSKLYNFYPQSKYIKKLESGFRGHRFPVEYNGKQIEIKYETSLKDDIKK